MLMNLINDQMINYYSTPGSILNLLDFANTNNVDLKKLNLKDFIKRLLMKKNIKKINLLNIYYIH